MKKLVSFIACLMIATLLIGCDKGSGNSSARTGNGTASVEDILEAGMAESDAKKNPEGNMTETVTGILSKENENIGETTSTDNKESNTTKTETTEIDKTEDDITDEEKNEGNLENKNDINNGDIPNNENTDDVKDTENPSSSGQDDIEKIDIDLTTLSSTMVYSEVYYMMTSPNDYLGKSVKMDGIFSVYHDEAADKYYFACIIQDATACCAQGIEFELKGDHVYPDDYPEEGTEICVTGVFDTYQEGEYLYCTLRNAKFDEPTL